MSAVEEAAQRVRIARTMHAARQDDESAEELAMALEALGKLMAASRVLPEDHKKNFGNPDFKP